MHIVSCTDTNFVIPLGVMMHSLCVNNEKEELHFHIIVDDTVTEQQKDELRTVVPEDGTIDFYLINIENIRQYLIVRVENFPVPIYYRLLMAKILPETIKKVLYLDADIIVRHDLSELWNTSLEGLAVAGVPNASFINHCERLGYASNLGYFNSGVLLFNLDYIRNKELTKQFIYYIKANPEKLIMPDQDVLNYVLRDCKLMLSVRNNAQEEFYRIPPVIKYVDDQSLEEGIRNPNIVHYTGIKPWNSNSRHPLKNLYYNYKNATIWRDNLYMESFRYKKIKNSFLIQIKILIVDMMRFFGCYKKVEPITLNYLDIHLDR